VFSGEQRLTDAQLTELDAWVEADLVKSAATWKIVLTHVPIYEVHSDRTATAAREHWLPLFEKYGVSLMLVGHQHVYSRLKPLTDGAEDYADGIVQIMGNSGQKHYSSADETLAERTIYYTPTYQVLSVDGDSLTVQTFDGDGTELDYTTLTPRSATVTRAEFVSALYRAAGSPTAPNANPFSDVPSDSEHADALAWAAENGIVNGVGGGKFEPTSRIRAEHAKLILERFGGNI
jgi:Calcineurin-like phosphoesterase./S-layer homology domain.